MLNTVVVISQLSTLADSKKVLAQEFFGKNEVTLEDVLRLRKKIIKLQHFGEKSYYAVLDAFLV